MNQGKVFSTTALCLSLLAWGCSKSSNSGQGQANGGADARPDQVIAEFLEAVRTGDDGKAARLLTPLARKKTSEMEMVVAPPGSETAKFQVLGVELAGDGGRVSSDWTDLDTDGRPHTDRIVWILRKEAEGWRIAGMETRVFADQEPILLNFEDPADMLRKQQQAEEEIARRDQQSAASTNSSSDGADARVR